MESIINQLRLKFLYSYSKQSLAPAVSTVGFFFLKACRISTGWSGEKSKVEGPHRGLLSLYTGKESDVYKKRSSCRQLMCVAYTLVNNTLFLAFG